MRTAREISGVHGSIQNPIMRGLVLAVALFAPLLAKASDLKVAWSPASEATAAGYHLYIGEQPGSYDRRIDVGAALSTTLEGLQDERLYHITVKPYDHAGRESSAVSPTLECYARPRVDSVVPGAISPGQTAYITLTGVNFGGASQVRSLDGRLRVRSVVPGGVGQLILLVEAAPAPKRGAGGEAVSLEGAFSPVAGCRKAEVFFYAHPEMTDVDGSGRIDQTDLEVVRGAFGARKGEAAYTDAADLDRDGSVDGRDIARVVERLGHDAEARAVAAPHGR